MYINPDDAEILIGEEATAAYEEVKDKVLGQEAEAEDDGRQPGEFLARRQRIDEDGHPAEERGDEHGDGPPVDEPLGLDLLRLEFRREFPQQREHHDGAECHEEYRPNEHQNARPRPLLLFERIEIELGTHNSSVPRRMPVRRGQALRIIVGREVDVEEPTETGSETSSNVTFLQQQDAPPCADCGSIMIRNGTCYKCLNCGSTSGCG